MNKLNLKGGRKKREKKKETTKKGKTFPHVELGACLTAPTKRNRKDLEDVSYHCDLVRNAVVEAWLMWWRRNPDYEPGQAIDRQGNPKWKPNGEPMLDKAAYPQEAYTEFYRVARDTAPHLASSIVTACLDEVLDWLRGNVSYDHKGKAQFRWQAILWHEDAASLPRYLRRRTIPIKMSSTLLVYNGHVHRDGPDMKHAVECGKQSCVLKTALFSNDSGRHTRYAIWRLKVNPDAENAGKRGKKKKAGLSVGHRKILMRIASRDERFSLGDSKLVKGDDGRWRVALFYKGPVVGTYANKENVAVLTINPGAIAGRRVKPFLLTFPNGAKWQIGDGDAYRQNYYYVKQRRSRLRDRYKETLDGRGHGRGRVFARLRPYSKANPYMETAFIRKAVAEILKGMERFDCGTLEYREPTKPVRNHNDLWFPFNEVPFNWTELDFWLRHRLGHQSLRYVSPGNRRKGDSASQKKDTCPPMSMEDWLTLIGKDKSGKKKTDKDKGSDAA